MSVSINRKLKKCLFPLEWKIKQKLGIISPTAVIRHTMLQWCWGTTIGIQKGKLDSIHRLPFSPIIHIRSDYAELSRTPFEVWCDVYDYGR